MNSQRLFVLLVMFCAIVFTACTSPTPGSTVTPTPTTSASSSTTSSLVPTRAPAPTSAPAASYSAASSAAPRSSVASSAAPLPASAPAASASGASKAPASSAAPPSTSASSGSNRVQAGILTAGDVDDNLNFPFFQTYLNNTLDSSFGRTLPGVRVGDRVTLKLMGSDRRPLSNAWVRITPQGANQPIVERQAGSDGVFQFFPTLDGAGTATKFQLEIRKADTETSLQTVSLDLDKLYLDRTMEIPIANASGVLPPALDLMLVIDTTGSMQDELNYLTNEFRSIVGTVRAKYPNVSMRFGLIVYRDIGDEYVVRTFDFVTSADDMQKQLAAQYASGGGDTPEAVDQALGTAINATWRPGNVARMLFWVADAPSHPERHAAVLQAIQSARRKSLHIYPLAASGVEDQAEYLMRVAAVLTQGRHLFLTDDSGVGESHALPKIPCNIVTRLDNLMVRVIDSELSGVRVEPTSDQIIRTVGTYDKGVCTSKQ